MPKKPPTKLQKSKLLTKLAFVPSPKQSIHELGQIQIDLIDTISRTQGPRSPDGLHTPGILSRSSFPPKMSSCLPLLTPSFPSILLSSSSFVLYSNSLIFFTHLSMSALSDISSVSLLWAGSMFVSLVLFCFNGGFRLLLSPSFYLFPIVINI